MAQDVTLSTAQSYEKQVPLAECGGFRVAVLWV